MAGELQRTGVDAVDANAKDASSGEATASLARRGVTVGGRRLRRDGEREDEGMSGSGAEGGMGGISGEWHGVALRGGGWRVALRGYRPQCNVFFRVC